MVAKLLSTPNSGRFVIGIKVNSSEVDAIKWCLFEDGDNLCSHDFGKVKNMKDEFRLLIKILINFLIPREGTTDQISWYHKHFIFYLKNEDKINLPA